MVSACWNSDPPFFRCRIAKIRNTTYRVYYRIAPNHKYFDSKEIDVLLEHDGKLFPMEIEKTATPGRQLTRVFKVLDKSNMQRGTGAVLCMTERLGALDRDNLIVPVWLV